MIGLVDLNECSAMPTASITRIEQLPYLVMRIGEILAAVKPHLENKRLTPIYCFAVRHEYSETLRYMIKNMESEGLPKGCSFYEVDGSKTFDMRGPSGGVVSSVTCYLVAK